MSSSHSFRTLLLTLLAPALLLLPEIAAAADVFTIYAYGNGNVLRRIFEGMKGFVDDRGYRYMLLGLMLLTMIFVFVKGYLFGRPNAAPWLIVILSAFGLNVLLFSNGARADVVIQDSVHGEDYLVEDMPLILAGASALSSEMSRYMVILVESFYMGPDIPPELMLSNNNTYNFGSKILAGFRDVRVTEPLTKATFNEYIKNCVVPEMYLGKIRLREVLNSEPDQFWSKLASNNKARMTICYQHCGDLSGGAICSAAECPAPAPIGSYGSNRTSDEWRSGVAVACASDDASNSSHAKLEERITNIIGATAFNKLGTSMLRDSTLMDGVVSSAVVHLTGAAGASGVEHFARSGIMNMFTDSSVGVIANGGGEGLIQVMAHESARATQKSNWFIAAKVFADSVSYLWAALQAFIYAIFPIAIVLFMFPGLAGKAMAGYFGLLAWTALWMPFLAVVNYLSLSWLLEDIRQLGMVPMSYASLLPISEAGESMAAITAFLGTMVPVLTYGMVTGGQFALTQFAADAPAPAASQQAAREQATKSYSYGSIAAENIGMNKHDFTASTKLGYDAVSALSGAGATNFSKVRSWAGETQAGQLLGSSVATTRSGREGLESGSQSGVSRELSFDSYSDAGTQRAADMAAQAGAIDQTTASTIKEASRSRDESWRSHTDASATLARNSSIGDSLSGQISTSSSGAVKGALGLGAVGSAMLVGLGDQIDSRAGARFSQKLQEGGISPQQWLQKFGLSPASDAEAQQVLDHVGSNLAAVKRANPSLTTEQIEGVIGLQALAGVTSTDLDAMQAGGALSPESRRFVDRLRAEGIGSREVAGVALAGTGVVAGSAAVAKAAGLAAGAGAGATAGGAALLTLGVLGSMVDVKTGGDARFAVGRSADARVSADQREGSGLQHVQAFAVASGVKEAESRQRGFSAEIRAGFRQAEARNDGIRTKISDDGSVTLSFAERRATEAGVSITTVLGHAGFGLSAPDAIDQADGQIHRIGSDVDRDRVKVDGRIGDLERNVDQQAASARQMPGLPSLPAGLPATAAGAVQARVDRGELPHSAGSAGKPAAYGMADESIQMAMRGQAGINERFGGAIRDTVNRISAEGGDAVRIGQNVIAVPQEAAYRAMREAGALTSRVEKSVEQSRIVKDSVRRQYGDTVEVRPYFTDNGSTIFELIDRKSGAAVMAGLTREGSLTMLDSQHNEKDAGRFIQGIGGSLLADQSKYTNLNAVDAGQKFWNDSAAARSDAMFRLKTGTDLPQPSIRFDPAAMKRPAGD